MEKKSIGQFIATLRKANGMTQKQLAEKLNVSDKTVSRWERDESAPDLTLIPIIAEIFQVTSDEILQGRRLNQEDLSTPKNAAKTDKQTEHLLNHTSTKFSIQSTISVAVGILGLIAAMICNFGFNRAYIGFMISCIFYLISIISEIVFIRLAFFSIGGNDFEFEKLNAYKKCFVRTAIRTYYVIVFLFSITLPLATLPWDTYMGISLNDLAAHGIMYAVASTIICILVVWIVNRIAVKSGIYTLSEQDKEKSKKITSLRIRCSVILVIILIITLLLESTFVSNVSAGSFADGQTFTDIESFIEYMETPADSFDTGFAIAYYDEDGNEIIEEMVSTEYIYTADGKSIIAQYNCRNQDVAEIYYEYDNNTIKSITAYSGADISHFNSILDTAYTLWLVLSLMEIVVIGIVYNIKRQKL